MFSGVNTRWEIFFVIFGSFPGYVNGGIQTVVRVLSGGQIPPPPFNLNLILILPQCYLILTLPLCYLDLTSASSGISNHGLETTVQTLGYCVL